MNPLPTASSEANARVRPRATVSRRGFLGGASGAVVTATLSGVLVPPSAAGTSAWDDGSFWDDGGGWAD